MYDAEGYQVANPLNRFAIGDRDALKYVADGSLDLYLQHVLLGLIGVGFGIAALAWPGLLLAGLVAPAGAWAVARGVLEIIVAMHLRKVIDDEWVLALSGILSIAFGALLLAKPMEGALVIGVIIGCFLFVYGLAAILFSLRLRTLGNRLRGA